MADFKPTASQSAAINTRGSAALISAGAGSGKTKVLTQRLMSRVCDSVSPAELDSFLVITFTKAAAGELRGRITEELAAALAADPGNRRLRRQSALCRKAQISTIHGFCGALLRENCHLAGLTPDFKIMEDDRAAAMKAAALERTLDEYYENAARYPGFTQLADTIGAGRDDKRLSELVLSLHRKMQCHARPALWAKKQVALLNAPADDVSETPWGKYIMTWAAAQADYWAAELEKTLAAMEPFEKIKKAYSESVSDTASQLRRFRAELNKGWDSARACLPITFLRLNSLIKSPDTAVSDYVKSRRAACQTAAGNINGALYSDSKSLLEEMARSAPAMEALLELTLSFDENYSKSKRRSALVDYSDLEHLTAELLTDEDGNSTPLAQQISQRYTEIMVDEYQDVSQVQDTIFRAVSKNEKNLFMVGDVKQAIYRFRLADPGIFTSKYLSYKDAENAAEGEPRRIMLQENFRSRKEIINCANAVFSACMSRELGDIDYDDDAKLKFGAAGYEGDAPIPELLLLELRQDDEESESPDKTAAEADMVARRIEELMASGVTVGQKGAERPLSYGDIAILMRSANTVGGVYRSALARRGIPAAAGQGKDFFSAVEVSAVISMLALTDNPHQDIPLIAVLRSPAFGFSPDRLSKIRQSDKRGDFYTALTAAALSDDKCRYFLNTLSALRDAAPDISVAELLWRIYDKLDMLAICSAMSEGGERRQRLMELTELAERFEGTGYKGLHRFVLWLRRLSEKGLETGGNSGAVQILTVHKSKGLEFPVVFLCDTARQFNKQDSRETVLIHSELGLGPKVTDNTLRIEYPTLARNAIKLCTEREMLSEEMRLLYVALTRAKERLYITAALSKPAATVEKAASAVSFPMSPQVLAQAAHPALWLIYAALANEQRDLRISYINMAGAEGESVHATAPCAADEAAVEELKHRLSFVYPYRSAETLPSKVTATELKGRQTEDEDAQSVAPKKAVRFRLPELAAGDRAVSAAERGVATHLVLQYMDFSMAQSMESVKAEIERLRERRFISPREAAAVDAHAIVRLFSSPLGKRMLAAEKLRREFKFSILCDAEEIFGQAAGEKVLMQGVVDCCLEEEDGLVIIDYKTDRVKNPEETAQRAALYSPQLRAYAAALRRIYGKTVKDCVLYFLSSGEIVNIPEKDLQ